MTIRTARDGRALPTITMGAHMTMQMPDVERALGWALRQHANADPYLKDALARAVIEYGKATGREYRVRNEKLLTGDWIDSRR